MILFAQARCVADGKLMRVAIGVEARCSKVEASDAPAAAAAAPHEGERPAQKRTELDKKVDVLDKRNNALIQAGLAPKPKRKAESAPTTTRESEKKKARTSAAKGRKELEAAAKVEAPEAKAGAATEMEMETEMASPVPEAAVFEPEGWAIHPNNGFDRFLFVVATNRASSKITATSLPNDTVVVAHTALRKMLGSTLYLHSRLDPVLVSDVL